jgi:hypothetical protein
MSIIGMLTILEWHSDLMLDLMEDLYTHNGLLIGVKIDLYNLMSGGNQIYLTNLYIMSITERAKDMGVEELVKENRKVKEENESIKEDLENA